MDARSEKARRHPEEISEAASGRNCRAIPFLSGTEFRDGSVRACVNLCKPSPCNISNTKNFGYEIAVCGT
jgi:hypothetical protein